MLNRRPWAGQRCFIIGGGGSLKGFDFESLRGEHVIAINRAVEFAPFADIMFSLDARLYGWYTQRKIDGWEKFESFRGMRVWVETPGQNFGNDVLLVKYKGKHGLSIDLADGIYTGGNSGYAAVNLAAALGASQINLLGFDMASGNFHDGYPVPGGDPESRGWIDGFNGLAPMLADAGIKVINLSLGSKLQCFPFGVIKTVHEGEAVTAITCTGDRPLAFALCQKWMAQQTRQPDQWIVVDDGKEPLGYVPRGCTYIRREPKASDPKHTLLLNLKAALPCVEGDKIIFFEDDDYYAPRYVEEIAKALDAHDLAGYGLSKYYHICGKFHRHNNQEHASLGQTAMRKSLLPLFESLLDNGNQLVDLRLWRNCKGKKIIMQDHPSLYCGIKGMPGRAGIVRGHDALTPYYKGDLGRQILSEWVQDRGAYGRPECDIIIPTYNNDDLTIACFKSIRECTAGTNYRIIWVDNGSKATERVERSLEGMNHIPLRLDRNLGFVGAINAGLKISTAPYVCLLNNDTVVSPGWLRKLVCALKASEKLGIVGAITSPHPLPDRKLWPTGINSWIGLPKDYDSHHNTRHIEDQVRKKIFPEFDNLIDFNLQLEKLFPGETHDISFVAFLCAVMKREVIESVGLLDVNFDMGMWDDADYNRSARKAGYETKLLWDACIFHKGRSTFNLVQESEGFDTVALLKKNKQYLDKKWRGKNV